MKRHLVAAFLVLTCVSVPAFSYVRTVLPSGSPVLWPTIPIDYAINERGSLEVTDGSEFTAVSSAFGTWQAVANTNLQFNELTRTAKSGLIQDGESTVAWIENATDAVVMPDVPGETMIFRDAVNTTHIIESDIILNGVHFSWTTTADGSFTNKSGPLDVQDVVTHEIGHFVGFSHVTTRPSILFPITYAGSVRSLSLSQDEISAVQFVYPSAGAPADSNISGTVTRGGLGVPGAFIAAYQNGSPVVGAIADDSGIYTINRVPVGSYIVRAQPYSRILGTSSFYQDPAHVDGDFLSVFHQSVSPMRTAVEASASTVTVTAGMNTPNIDFEVQSVNCTNDAFEPNDTFSVAQAVTIDGNSQIHHSCGAGDADWAIYTATAGRLYVIETKQLGFSVTNASKNVNTLLELYDQTGTTRLDVDADPDVFWESGNRNTREVDYSSRIVWNEQSGGIRYIRMRQADSNLFGEGIYYSLSVTEIAGPGTPVVTGVTPSETTEDGA